MEIMLKCNSEQALLMAIDDFEKTYPGFKGVLFSECFLKVGEVFTFSVNSICTEYFLEFVQSKEFFKKYFQTEVSLNEVTGFISSENAVDAIDAFNDALSDFYIEPSVEIAEVRTDKGILYIPKICNCRLERIFWGFVFNRDTLVEKILTGNEVYQ